MYHHYFYHHHHQHQEHLASYAGQDDFVQIPYHVQHEDESSAGVIGVNSTPPHYYAYYHHQQQAFNHEQHDQIVGGNFADSAATGTSIEKGEETGCRKPKEKNKSRIHKKENPHPLASPMSSMEGKEGKSRRQSNSKQDVNPNNITDLQNKSKTKANNVGRRRRIRHNFTSGQSKSLEEVFDNVTHYPDYGLLADLGKKLRLPIERIQVWFQNRRAKFRRNSNITKWMSHVMVSWINITDFSSFIQ